MVNGNSTQLANQVAEAANSGLLRGVFIASGNVTQNPFDAPPYIPWENGWRLAVMPVAGGGWSHSLD